MLSTIMHPKWLEPANESKTQMSQLGNSLKLMLQNLHCEEYTVVDALKEGGFQGIWDNSKRLVNNYPTCKLHFSESDLLTDLGHPDLIQGHCPWWTPFFGQ